MDLALRVLAPGDEAVLESLLARHPDSSMFLRSNVMAAGLEDRGRRQQGTYVGAFDRGTLVAVAAHCWNGTMLVQAPVHADTVALEAARRSGRAVHGLLGPWEQVVAARHALGLDETPTARSTREELCSLALSDLVRPEVLDTPRITCRHTRDDELAQLVQWRVAFARQSLGETLDLGQARDEIQHWHDSGSAWVLERSGRPVSFSAFNARLPDIVQIGGVYTPPAERNRGYGRAVVAGSLIEARNSGVRRAVLFAEDPAAQKAYRALGFQSAGNYGLVIFR